MSRAVEHRHEQRGLRAELNQDEPTVRDGKLFARGATDDKGQVFAIVKAFEAPRMLAYSATDDSLFGLMTDHLSVLTCEPHPDGDTVFCWLAYGRPAKGTPMRWAGRKVFNFALNSGTKKLEQRFPTG